MELSRAAVLGAGPGGLYAARLLKLANPGCDVVVYEQGEPDKTFGFGVGLAAGTQRNLAAADPDTLSDLVATGTRHDMTLQVGGALARVANEQTVGIARTELLAILQRHAEKAGVRLEFGSRRTADELDADVVVAADGISSATRENGPFGGRVDVGRGLFLWCGAGFSLDDAVFAPVETEHGVFVTHAYPYSGGRSTFLIETDEATWRRAGFDVTTEATPFDESDETSLRFLAGAFAEQLHGHPLIGNRTRWSRFRTVRCERWSAGRTVLLGDAAHTAHFSIGSGTKLAMEDAIGLVQALAAAPDAATAFSAYESARRPAVERLQELARRSQLWWESFPERLHLPVERLMVAFMSRAGNVPLARFAEAEPALVGAALGQYAGSGRPVGPVDGFGPAVGTGPALGAEPAVGPEPAMGAELGRPAAPAAEEPVGDEPARVRPEDVTSWVFAQPLGEHPSRVLTEAAGLERIEVALADPWSEPADALVAAVVAGRAYLVAGPPGRDALLTRLDLAERLRQAGARVVVAGAEQHAADLAAGLVSGRTDLILFTAEEDA